MIVSDKVDALSSEIEVLKCLEDPVFLVLYFHLIVMSVSQSLLVDQVQTRDHNHWFIAWKRGEEGGGEEEREGRRKRRREGREGGEEEEVRGGKEEEKK